MRFDTSNKIIQLCTEGMRLEGEGNPASAHHLFQQAWIEAGSDFEKFVAAHYLARHQDSVQDKLKWDETALLHLLRIKDESTQSHYPSLYLNIGKCHEDLGHAEMANLNYRKALSLADSLPDDGYGKMIKAGIHAGLERVTQ